MARPVTGDPLERLTSLDQRVLALVPAGVGRRAGAIAKSLKGTNTAEVRGILRGFEHLGHVTQRSGWWRKTNGSSAARSRR